MSSSQDLFFFALSSYSYGGGAFYLKWLLNWLSWRSTCCPCLFRPTANLSLFRGYLVTSIFPLLFSSWPVSDGWRHYNFQLPTSGRLAMRIGRRSLRLLDIRAPNNAFLRNVPKAPDNIWWSSYPSFWETLNCDGDIRLPKSRCPHLA